MLNFDELYNIFLKEKKKDRKLTMENCFATKDNALNLFVKLFSLSDDNKLVSQVYKDKCELFFNGFFMFDVLTQKDVFTEVFSYTWQEENDFFEQMDVPAIKKQLKTKYAKLWEKTYPMPFVNSRVMCEKMYEMIKLTCHPYDEFSNKIIACIQRYTDNEILRCSALATIDLTLRYVKEAVKPLTQNDIRGWLTYFDKQYQLKMTASAIIIDNINVLSEIVCEYKKRLDLFK